MAMTRDAILRRCGHARQSGRRLADAANAAVIGPVTKKGLVCWKRLGQTVPAGNSVASKDPGGIGRAAQGALEHEGAPSSTCLPRYRNPEFRPMSLPDNGFQHSHKSIEDKHE